MADEEIQKVKMTGALWTLQSILGIIRDVLIILVMLAALWSLLVVVPQMMRGLGALSSLSSGTGSPNSYSGGNSPNSYGGSPNANTANLQNLGNQLRNDVDSGNWDAAQNDLNQVKAVSSLLPPQIQQALPQVEQAIQNKDKASLDQLYNQFQQAQP